MNKGLDKSQIIEVALNLINRQEGIAGVNLREIARILNCAHTNLYNYFPDFNELLWEAFDAAGIKLREYILENLDQIENPHLRLEFYYRRLLDFYLQNKGWFRLFWLEPISSKRPQNSIDVTVYLVDKLVTFMQDVFFLLFGEKISREKTTYIVHTVHCYLFGEISIFIAGRGLIKEEQQFKTHVLQECLKITRLLFVTE